jgi:hypothetical protein
MNDSEQKEERPPVYFFELWWRNHFEDKLSDPIIEASFKEVANAAWREAYITGFDDGRTFQHLITKED